MIRQTGKINEEAVVINEKLSHEEDEVYVVIHEKFSDEVDEETTEEVFSCKVCLVTP